MKTLVIFSMAIVASQAFFLPNDFFTDIAHRMTDLHHAVRPQGQFSHRPHPPLIPLPETTNDATHQRMSDLFESLTPEEQAALKNHLFGQKFPRPLPASHHGSHPKFSDEQVEAARAKWNSMTPEQQQAFREKYQKPQSFRNSDSSESSSSSSEDSSEERNRLRRPRSIPAAHHKVDHQKASDEKLQAIRERWEAMTPEEREAVKNGRRKHYKAHEVPLARPQKPPVRSPRTFQAIKPLPEYLGSRRPSNVALNPESDYAAMLQKMNGMTQEEQIKYIRELYPQGMPIRPLTQVIDPNYSRPVLQPFEPAAAKPIQPYLFPIAARPLLPLDIQPIFPLPYFSDPAETNFLGPIPLPSQQGEPEEEEIEDGDDSGFMPY